LLAGPRAGAAADQAGRLAGSLNSPRATITAEPPTSTRSTLSAVPSARAKSLDGRATSTPCEISISSPKAIRPWRARRNASRPAPDPAAACFATPTPREHRGLLTPFARTAPRTSPEPDVDRLQWPRKHERGPQCRMPRERHLLDRCENSDFRVPAGLGRQHERHLREVDLARKGLHRFAAEPASVGEDGEL